MLPIQNVSLTKSIQNVIYSKCTIRKWTYNEMLPIRKLPIQNVTYTKCYLYEMLPRQIVLYENEPITKYYYTEMYYINCYWPV